jgi:hypothetical protein
MLGGLLLSASPPVRLSAQLSLQPSLGLRYSSALVHDSIVTTVDVRPALAPALALTAATPLERGRERERGRSAEAVIDFSTSGLDRHDGGGAAVGLGGTVATLSMQVGVRQPVMAGLSCRVSVGGLKYFPSERSGIFRSGAGGVFALAGAALSYAPPGARAGRWGFGVEARYDVHQFITPALRQQGFTSSRTVHRIALAVRAGRAAP